MVCETEMLSTEMSNVLKELFSNHSNFLKQIIIFKSINSIFMDYTFWMNGYYLKG